MSEHQKMYYYCEGYKNPVTNELEHVEQPETASAFMERYLTTPSPSETLVPTSIRLPEGLINCIEQNSKILGMSKSDFHKKALEIGINQLTSAYENMVCDKDSTTIMVD